MQLPLFEGTLPGQANRAPKRKQAGRLVSYSSARNQWQTPQNIVDHAVAALGAIDLDPCSDSNLENIVPARLHFGAEDNSLSRRWIGRVWLNPPYGRAIGSWIEKLTHEYETGDVTSAVALVPARTDTQWWQSIAAYPYCALHGRVKFIRIDGRKSQPMFPSAVVYLGPQLARFAGAFADLGTIYFPYSLDPPGR